MTLSAYDVTSPVTAMSLPSALPMVARSPSERSRTPTHAPSAKKRSTTAKPIPAAPPPVTRATCPVNQLKTIVPPVMRNALVALHLPASVLAAEWGVYPRSAVEAPIHAGLDARARRVRGDVYANGPMGSEAASQTTRGNGHERVRMCL